jgi:hypothetical protein
MPLGMEQMIKATVYVNEPPNDAWALDICKVGKGHACCRYLTMASDGWSCEKHTSLRETIDRRVLSRQMVARGDNCDGKKSR